MLNRTDSTADATAGGDLPAVEAYAAARQHSQRVRRLKVILPIGALVISLVFIAVSFIRSWVPENLSVLGTKIEDGKIVMEKPVISGRNSDGISYSMTAERALQDIRNPNSLTLEDIKAAVPLNETVIARVVAISGDFDRSTDRLAMTAPFEIDLSTGLSAKFQTAQIDVKGGTMTSDDPVTILTQEASIVANRLKITDNGHIITFSGDVRVNVDPAAIRNKSSESRP